MVDYKPFLYPPDYQLAKLHQCCTMPGKICTNSDQKKLKIEDQQSSSNLSSYICAAQFCPCCKQSPKLPLSAWSPRSVTEDFKYYGGAVVTYFWLIKLYAIITGLVLVIYSAYLYVCTIKYCDEQICSKFMFFIWVVSNQQLYQIMRRAYRQNQDMDLYILFTLRAVAYVILIGGNTAALYLVSRFKRRYPRTHGIQKFSLIFKNLPESESVEDLFLKLKTDFADLKVEQIFQLKKMEPFYTLYNTKLEVYYENLIEQNPKKLKKLIKNLQILEQKCNTMQPKFEEKADRAIIVLESEALRNQILQKYGKNSIKFSIKYLLGFQIQTLYCEPCPMPEQIIWNNIGQHQQQKIKLKILSVVYFFILIGLSYLILYFCMEVIYKDILQQPWNFLATNIILFFMVYIALTFRQLMNKLSQMRYPNTQTNRTLFIVLTTVLFHFIYYLIIPTVYLANAKEKDRNQVMALITNQIFNFMLVQFILAGMDFIHYVWHKNLKKVENKEKPIGCQKILHKKLEYPRFPIQFKLIILFKIFSFITLTAFQTPTLLLLIFIFLVFLYWRDKKAVYYNYRMEIIDNKVQYYFLKIYSSFYTVYIFLVFATTQHLDIQFWGGLGIMILALVIQIFFIKERKVSDESKKEELGIIGMGNKSGIYLKKRQKQDSIISDYSEQFRESYKRRYDQFRSNITNESINAKISEYLSVNGYANMKTESSIAKQRLL